MTGTGRIQHAGLAARVVDAEQAAAHVRHGDTVGMSGFTGAGYPKVVPQALARRITAAHDAGDPFRVNVWTATHRSGNLVPWNTVPVITGSM